MLIEFVFNKFSMAMNTIWMFIVTLTFCLLDLIHPWNIIANYAFIFILKNCLSKIQLRVSIKVANSLIWIDFLLFLLLRDIILLRNLLSNFSLHILNRLRIHKLVYLIQLIPRMKFKRFIKILKRFIKVIFHLKKFLKIWIFIIVLTWIILFCLKLCHILLVFFVTN
jgi:hypothetical protein